PEGTEGVKVNAPIARLKGEEGATAAPAPAPAPQAPAAKPQEPPKAAAAPTTPEPQPMKAAALDAGRGPRVFASPLARRIAEQSGVDLSAVKGSGPHGRIIKRDLEGK